MTPDEYQELGRHIWSTYVPKKGQSVTVQGELLRAIEKLRDEAQRNGNMNWDGGHEMLTAYLLDTLAADPSLHADKKSQLSHDIARIRQSDDPYVDDDLYDRVSNAVLDWCAGHPDPVPRALNPALHR